mmetsp:Transcript_19254/g.41466  ORF Transcript_19254/g.41466 Transcript_19254/m.41466 type:complete len:223 (+) Transcript_19254:89-757(+)
MGLTPISIKEGAKNKNNKELLPVIRALLGASRCEAHSFAELNYVNFPKAARRARRVSRDKVFFPALRSRRFRPRASTFSSVSTSRTPIPASLRWTLPSSAAVHREPALQSSLVRHASGGCAFVSAVHAVMLSSPKAFNPAARRRSLREESRSARAKSSGVATPTWTSFCSAAAKSAAVHVGRPSQRSAESCLSLTMSSTPLRSDTALGLHRPTSRNASTSSW